MNHLLSSLTCFHREIIRSTTSKAVISLLIELHRPNREAEFSYTPGIVLYRTRTNDRFATLRCSVEIFLRPHSNIADEMFRARLRMLCKIFVVVPLPRLVDKVIRKR